MANVRYLRKLPQRYGLTGMASRTPIEEKIGQRGNYPYPLSGIPSTGLTKLAEEKQSPVKITSPTLTSFSEMGGGAGVGPGEGTGGMSGVNEGPAAPQGIGDVIGNEIGNNIAASMGGRALGSLTKGATMAAILGQLSKSAPSILGSATVSALNPLSLANTIIGNAITGQAVNAEMTSPAASDLPANVANQTAVNAISNSPTSVLGHLAAVLGLTPSVNEAASQAVDVANMAMAPAVTGGIPSNAGNPTGAGAETGAGTSSPGQGGEGVGTGVGGTGPGPVGPGTGAPGPGGEGGGSAGAGGTVICTELHRQGLMPDYIYRADSDYGSRLPYDVVRGYQMIGRPLARLMSKSRFVTALVKPIALKWAYQMAFKEGVIKSGNRTGAFIEFIGIPLCRLINAAIPERRQKLSPSQLRSCS